MKETVTETLWLEQSLRTNKKSFQKRDEIHPDKNTKKEGIEEIIRTRREIQESSIGDFKDWVNGCVSKMETSNDQDNTRKTFTVLNHLTKKPKSPPQGITRKADDELITSPEEVVDL